jgi:hypothetical protein
MRPRRISALSDHRGLAAILLLSLALAGCVDNSAVVVFSQICAQSASYSSIVSDYVDSAARELRYAPDNGELRQMEVEAKGNRKDLEIIQQEVVDYMTAIGVLAGDQRSGMASGSSAIVGSMVTTKLISPSDKDSATALADLIARLATQGYQDSQLRSIIEKSNAPFQGLIGALKKFVGTEYPARLDAEEARLRQTLYEDIADNTQLGTDQRPAKTLASILYSERSVELESKKENAKAYLPILEKIAAGHQALYDGRDHLDAKDLVDHLKSYSSDIKTIYSRLKP